MNQNTKALLVASASGNKIVASKIKAYLNSLSNATKATNNYNEAVRKIRMVNEKYSGKKIPTMTAIAVLYILNYLTGLSRKNTNNGRNAKKLLNSLVKNNLPRIQRVTNFKGAMKRADIRAMPTGNTNAHRSHHNLVLEELGELNMTRYLSPILRGAGRSIPVPPPNKIPGNLPPRQNYLNRLLAQSGGKGHY